MEDFMAIFGLFLAAIFIYGLISNGRTRPWDEQLSNLLKKEIEKEVKIALYQPESPFFPRTPLEKKQDVFNAIEMSKMMLSMNSKYYRDKFLLTDEKFTIFLDNVISETHKKYHTL